MLIPKDIFSNTFSGFQAEYPGIQLEPLIKKIYSETLTPDDEEAWMQLVEFARSLSRHDSAYDGVYSSLLHLFVLNGSRLDALKSMSRHLRSLESNSGSLLLVAGVAGIGKTSLVLAFQEHMQKSGFPFVICRCQAHETTSFSLWQSVVQNMSTQKGVSAPDLFAASQNETSTKSLQHLIRELSNWLTETTISSPLVVLLDDLHWADTDSLEILDTLTSQGPRLPILFIATYRSEEARRGNALYDYLPKLQRNRPFEQIRIEPLNQEDINRLVGAMYGKCSSQLATYLFDRAEGHSLFTVELLNNLVDQNFLTQDDEGFWLPPQESVPVPKQLQQLIAQRVSRLSDRVEAMLKVAAVIGETWELQIVEQVLDMSEDDLLDALETTLQAELVFVEDDSTETYRFAHGLINEVLYTQQISRHRKRLHGQIALAYEEQRPDRVFAISHHYYAAENWNKAVQYCRDAGREASSHFATNSALMLYQQALNAAERLTNRIEPQLYIEILERIGHMYHTLGMRRHSEIAYNRLREFAKRMGNLEAEGHALATLALLQTAISRDGIAEQTTVEALKIAEQTGNTELLGRVNLSQGKSLFTRGFLKEGAHHLDMAIEHARSSNDPITMSEAHRYRAFIALYRGRYEVAKSHAEQALENALMTDDLFLHAGCNQILSLVQIEIGDYLDAYKLIHSMLAVRVSSDARYHQLPRILNQAGYLFLEIGNAAEALAWDNRALEATQNKQDDRSAEMQRYTMLNIATDLLLLGKIDEVYEWVSQYENVKIAADVSYFRYHNRYYLLMSELNVVEGKFEDAIQFAQQAREMAENNRILKNIAKSYWFEGRALSGLMQHKQAIQLFNAALEIADHIQHGSLTWKIRLDLAEAHIKLGKSPNKIVGETRQLLNHVIAIVSGSDLEESLMSSGWMKRLNKLEQTQSPKKPAYPAGLTRREVEVLKLVATGATNQQVADTLHISVRTVNTHLTNIFNKTNCDNRTAATAFAIQHKLVST